MKNARNARKAIVMISDGGDNSSNYTAAADRRTGARRRCGDLRHGRVRPDLRSLLSPEEISGPKLLSEIATQTGGRAFAAAVSSDLPSVAARIAIELRNQYVLGYYPRTRCATASITPSK